MTCTFSRLPCVTKTPAAALRSPPRGFLTLILLLTLGTAAPAANPGATQPSATQPSATQPEAMQFRARSTDPGQALVSGTSTLHDWTVKSGTINGKAAFTGLWKARSVPSIAIQSISLSIPVSSLKSTEGSGMDDKVYEALNLKHFPTITYSLAQATLGSSPSLQSPEYRFNTIGQLTVAGGSRQVKLDLHVVPGDNGQLTIATQIAVKMSDFGVKPPTAMLGVIKSGDAITLKVTWRLTTQPRTSDDRK